MGSGGGCLEAWGGGGAVITETIKVNKLSANYVLHIKLNILLEHR